MSLDYARRQQPTESELAILDLPSTYFVAPIVSNEGFQSCLYYTSDWSQITAPIHLKYYYKRINGNSVVIYRPPNDQITPHLPPNTTVDSERSLFSAIAQTRGGEEMLPNVFHAHNQILVIPNLFAEGKAGYRALVLVFSKPTDDGFELRATSDPIIKPDPKV